MSTLLAKEKFESLPEEKRVCNVFGTPITHEQYLKAGGYYSHPSLWALKKRLKLSIPELREKLKTCLHSPINGGYYETWKSLAIAEAQLGATDEQLEAAYNELVYPTSNCRFPGCTAHVPYAQRADGCCSTLHKNQFKRIRKGEYSVEDLKHECFLCHNRFKTPEGVAKHLRETHNYTDEDLGEYYNTYCRKPGDSGGKCRYCGKPTSFQGIVHGYSDFCYNTDCNVRWYNENTDRLVKAGDGIKEAMASGDVTPSQIGYWLKQGYSQDEAEALLRERQTTNSITSIIQREGCTIEEAKVIRRNITRKWLKSRTTGLNWSKISQELFWALWKRIKPFYLPCDVYFATFDEGEEDTSRNREYRIKTESSYRLADFFIESEDLSIEFDGAFHHSADSWRGARYDEKRDEEILRARPNHRILHVRETDYRKDPQSVITACINFIFNNRAS